MGVNHIDFLQLGTRIHGASRHRRGTLEQGTKSQILTSCPAVSWGLIRGRTLAVLICSWDRLSILPKRGKMVKLLKKKN